jgi:hypothetical protein
MLTSLIMAHVVLTGGMPQQDPYARYKEKLVPIGKKVPNFTVKDENGKDFDLYKSFTKDTKATLLNFWFST